MKNVDYWEKVNQLKTKNVGVFSMFLGTLGDNLLENLLAGKRVINAGE